MKNNNFGELNIVDPHDQVLKKTRDATRNYSISPALSEAILATNQWKETFSGLNSGSFALLTQTLKNINSQSDFAAELKFQLSGITALTSGMAKLQFDFLEQNEISGIVNFAKTFNNAIILAPDLAFLKTASYYDKLITPTLPRGYKSVLNNLHSGTAEKLLHCNDLEFNIVTKEFSEKGESENSASVFETNILLSALDIFTGLTETEMLDFMNYLAKYRELAGTHEVGKKIINYIENWKDTISFDFDTYYHSRARKKEECPYTDSDMGKAPKGVTWHGRYNNIGDNHYYFSDKEQGALIEVKKHCSPDMVIQTVKIQPEKNVTIRMIDLSADTAKPNKFLEYCRFSPDPNDKSHIKREYLVPCFVATCCKLHKLNGIKYYGSKDYSNYVTWDDGYFKILAHLL